ncbi:histidine kinase, partial [Mesorhizobium sp. M8A.F.Ca.ET.142.01.1.1]
MPWADRARRCHNRKAHPFAVRQATTMTTSEPSPRQARQAL